MSGYHNTNTASQSPFLTAKEQGFQINYPFELKKMRLDNDIELAYIDEGDGNEIMLFIHGVGSGIPLWKKNILYLRKKYRCIAIDLPGHGYSTKSGFTYTMGFYVDAVREFIDKLGLTGITLAGHSMGAQISALLALQSDGIVKKLALISPAGIEPYNIFENQLQLTGLLAINAGGNALTNNYLTFLTGFNYDRAMTKEAISQLAFFKNEALHFSYMVFHSAKGMLSAPIYPELKNIKQDCLILIGETDLVSPYNHFRIESYADVAYRISKNIPRVKRIKVPAGGHFLHYQMPELVNRELENLSTSTFQ